MKSLKIIAVIALAMALIFLAAPLAHGAPSADGTLNNGSFEGGTYLYNNDPDMHYVPDGWTPWWIDGGTVNCPSDGISTTYQKPKVEVEQHPTHVKDGVQSGRVYTAYSTGNMGLYQQVAATPGSTYEFAAWGFLWATNNPVVDSPSSDPIETFQVGIDPSGGTNVSSVKWSGGTTTMDTFTQQKIQATATGSQITVYLRVTSQYCVARNDAFFDAATLTVVSTGPAPTAPGAKPPPPPPPSSWGVLAGSIITATPQPDGSIVHTVHAGETCDGIAVTYGITRQDILTLNNLKSCSIISVGQKLIVKAAGSAPTGAAPLVPGSQTPTGAATSGGPTMTPTSAQVADAQKTGTICVMGYDDKNGNGIREPTESKLAGMTFTVTGASGPVANYTTDGVAEPHCFAQLQPGSYTVTWSGDSLTPTGDQSWSVNLTAGSTASREFGAKGGSAAGGTGGTGATSGPGAGEGEGLPTWAIALIGAFGVILFMGGLGVAGYFLLLRRTKI